MTPEEKSVEQIAENCMSPSWSKCDSLDVRTYYENSVIQQRFILALQEERRKRGEIESENVKLKNEIESFNRVREERNKLRKENDCLVGKHHKFKSKLQSQDELIKKLGEALKDTADALNGGPGMYAYTCLGCGARFGDRCLEGCIRSNAQKALAMLPKDEKEKL